MYLVSLRHRSHLRIKAWKGTVKEVLQLYFEHRMGAGKKLLLRFCAAVETASFKGKPDWFTLQCRVLHLKKKRECFRIFLGMKSYVCLPAVQIHVVAKLSYFKQFKYFSKRQSAKSTKVYRAKTQNIPSKLFSTSYTIICHFSPMQKVIVSFHRRAVDTWLL